jgi:hypothetical protein
MRKSWLYLLLIPALLIVGILTFPLFFKDKIFDAVDRQIHKYIDADISYNRDATAITILSSFPDLTLSLEDLHLSGKGKFDGDTLIHVEELEVTVDIKKAINGSIEVKEIIANQPFIQLIILEDLSANYDIAISDSSSQDATATTDTSAILLEHWEINNGRMVYEDRGLDFIMTLNGVSHSGDGVIKGSDINISTLSEIVSANMEFDEVKYMSNDLVKAEVDMLLNLDNFRFTFKENTATINDFPLHADGWFQLNEENFTMDIDYAAPNATFKSFLSLIPALYVEDFEELKANGQFTLKGSAKGVYDDQPEIYPSIVMDIIAKDGTIKYPDMPRSIEDLSMELHLKFMEGDFDQWLANSFIQLKNLNMQLGPDYLKGNFTLDKMEDYKADLATSVDLSKLNDVFHLGDSTLMEGMINGSVNITGQLSDTTYRNTKASGGLTLQNFKYADPDNPMVLVTSGQLDFNPAYIELKNLNGKLDQSDFQVTGRVEDYIAYALDDHLLKGKMTLNSGYFNANPFMTDEGDDTTVEEEDSVAKVEIPENLDLVFQANIDRLDYTNLSLTNAQGEIAVTKGNINLNDLTFDLLGGKFAINASYLGKPQDNKNFTTEFSIKQLPFSKAIQSLEMVQNFAPIAAYLNGDFSTDLKLTGLLNDEFSPEPTSLTGGGLIKIANAAMKDVPALNQIASTLKTKDLSNTKLKDVIMTATFQDGRLQFDPFDVNLAGMNLTLAGYSMFDGTIDYDVLFDITGTSYARALQTNQLGFAVEGPFSSPTVKPDLQNVLANRLKKEIAPYKEAAEQAKNEAKDLAKETANKAKDQAKDAAKQEVGNLIDNTLGLKRNQDSTDAKQDLKDTGKEAADQVKDKVKDIKKLNPFKK